ncbi:helix-turn-helix domain-containing protein [Candidatus Rariloculus sp.]|uniref:helix-turn-helix domain-containing protein n=1 Tax=Candidatus Rariloculus sp. TaxID=3101265 RepID=UPI003D121294
MSTFGDDLIRSLSEALAHAKGDGPAVVHVPVTPREVRKRANLTQAQMAPLMGMSLSGYRKWEQGTRRVSGPAATLLRVIAKEPEAVRRALLPAEQAQKYRCRARPSQQP